MADCTKSGYLIAAHYFGNCGVANFWSSHEPERVAGDLEKIRQDGFNAIILVVPWSGFQTSVAPVSYEPSYVADLRNIFATAARLGLRVALRLGYLWESEFMPDRSFERYRDSYFERAYRQAWRDYFRFFEDLLREQDNFLFAFLSWEDFYWPMYRHYVAEPSAAVRRAAAARTGFTAFLAGRYALADIPQASGGWDQLAIPCHPEQGGEAAPDVPSAPNLQREFLLFFERGMRDMVCEARQACPGLLFEYKCDPEFYRAAPRNAPYFFARTLAGAGPAITYYNPLSTVFSADRRAYGHRTALLRAWAGRLTGRGRQLLQQWSGRDAAQGNHFREWLRFNQGFAAASGRLDRPAGKAPGLFIDQLNFYDNTFTDDPDFRHVGKLARTLDASDSALGRFLGDLATVLRDNTIGYGIWAYRDLVLDQIFNAGFRRGLMGWQANEPLVRYAAKPQARGHITLYHHLVVRPGGEISQNLGYVRIDPSGHTVTVRVQGQCESTCRLEIRLFGRRLETSVDPGWLDLRLPIDVVDARDPRLRLRCLGGDLLLDRLSVYHLVLSNRIYDENGVPRSQRDALVALNRSLTGGGCRDPAQQQWQGGEQGAEQQEPGPQQTQFDQSGRQQSDDDP